MADTIIDTYCNGISLTNQEVLSELEIIKTFKGNEVILDNLNKNAAREYVALDCACKLVEFEVEKESHSITDYDSAIESLTNFIKQNKYNENINDFKLALNALIQVRDLNIKIENHKKVY